MHVAIYLDAFEPNSGGAYTFETAILRALAGIAGETRHRFTIFTPAPMTTLRSQGVPPPLKVVRTPPHCLLTAARPRTLRDAAGAIIDHLVPAARFGMNPLQPERWFKDALHRNGCQFVWFPTTAAFPVDEPYMCVLWDLEHRNQPFFPEVSAAGIWDHRENHFRPLLQRAAKIVVGTAAGQTQVQDFYGVPGHRIRVIAMPVQDFSAERNGEPFESLRSRFGLAPGYFLYPAQFWPHKNHATLVEAFRRLLDAGTPRHLVLTGSDQGNAAHITALINRYGLHRHVQWLGFVSTDLLITLYRHARALVFPSLFGPDNIPPLEAMALGCPVLLADFPGHREQCGDAAMYFDPLSAESLAEAVLTIDDSDNLRTDLIARGSLRVKGRSATDYVRSIVNVLDEFEPLRACWP